jgi:hypothetical protein
LFSIYEILYNRSALYFDWALLVNDDGLHGMVEKCADKDLASGSHVVYIEGFQAGGGVGMVATYSGPDTGGEKVLMRSGKVMKSSRYYSQCDPSAQEDASQFTVCIFRSSVGLGSIPKIAMADSGSGPLSFVGKGRMSVVDVHDVGQFRSAVARTPDVNYAWAIYGQLMIGVSGRYRLCITSDDG